MNVAHLPGSHPYVTAVDPSGLRRGDDWDIAELVEVGAGLVHVHFGFERFEPESLRRWIRAVKERGIAVVHTVHDIDNPHLVDQRLHHVRTGLLVEAADAVVTLTPAAAEVIRRRWHREVSVIAHPPLASGRRTTSPRSARPLVWLGTLRPNVDRDIVTSMVRTSDSSLDVVIRDEGWRDADDALREELTAAAGAGRIDLSIIARPSDDQLDELIAAAGALILPYAWGTHSGLVELAAALGVATVTTPTGCRGDQGAIVAAGDELLARARVAARGPRPVRSATTVADVRAAHRLMYETVVSGRGVST